MNVKGLALAAGLALALTAAVAPAAAIEGDETGVRIGLDEALRIALENNLDLVIARKDPRIAEQSAEVAEADFDPNLSTGLTHSVNRDEPFNPFSPNRFERTALELEWGQRLGFGGSYGVTLSTGRTNLTGPLFPEITGYTTNLQLQYSMPLLRGLGEEVNREQIIVARRAIEISREELRRQAETTLKGVEDAYWDVVAAREGVRVARQSFDLARDLLELNRKKVEVGTLAPIEITQAEAGVASREEGVIRAETALEAAEDNLRKLLAIPRDDVRWGLRLVPTDSPSFAARSVDAAAVLAKALENRPELATARKQLLDRELAERSAKNRMRHGLDFNASVSPSGVDATFADSASEVPDFENYAWSAGLLYSLPIGNRAAKARHATAAIEVEKSELALANLEQTIRVDVRNAVRNVESGIKRVRAAEASTVLQQKKLEAEQKKFENGMSTSFEVLTFQSDLANAQLAEIQARLDYMKSLADLERAQGTLLEARGLRLDAGEGR